MTSTTVLRVLATLKRQTWVYNMHLTSLGLLVVGVVVLFLPALSLAVPASDYRAHYEDARYLLYGTPLEVFGVIRPHFLFHLLVSAAVTVFPRLSLENAGFAVALVAYVITGLALYLGCITFAGQPGRLRVGLVYAAAALLLMLVAPVSLLTPGNMYFGYIPINVYHNPTVTLLKPFAVMLFILAVLILDNRLRRWPLLVALAGAVLTVLATLAKPSYTVAFAPALALVVGSCLLKGRWRQGILLWAGFVLPAAVVLVVQLSFFNQNNGVTVAPLAVMNRWLEVFYPGNYLGVLPRLALSILFPAYVYLVYRCSARKHMGLNLAWMVFGFGAAYTYLLAEAGEKLTDGNWTWSGQVTLFVLFAVSTLFWMKQSRVVLTTVGRGRASVGWWGGLALFGLHLISGLYWYTIHIDPTLLKDALHYYY